MPGEIQKSAIRRSAGFAPPLDSYDADIIILSLGRPMETAAAINSALSQRGGLFHVTVLDQGSSLEMILRLRKAFSRFRHFALYESSENLGVPGGRSTAAKLGHGQFVVSLDNDAIFADDWVVAKALRLFRQRPDLAAIGFNILAEDGKHPDLTSWGYPKAMLPRFKETFDTTTFVGAGHAIRRSAWIAADGFDASLFFTWEEYDFCLKVIALNWRIAYAGSMAVIHKVSPEARVSWNGERTRYFIRNRLIIGRKWGRSWLALTPRILTYLLKSARLGQIEPAWAGILAAFRTELPPPRRMSRAMRAYIRHNETYRRGSWFDRFRFELLGPLSH